MRSICWVAGLGSKIAERTDRFRYSQPMAHGGVDSRHHFMRHILLGFQMLTAFDDAACFGSFRLTGAARYEFRYSAYPLLFKNFAFVRGRLECGRFSLSTPDYGMRCGLGIRSRFSFGASVFVFLAN